MNKQEILDFKNALNKGDMRLFQKYYKQYQSEFLKFGMKYCQDEQVVLDTYHDVFLIFYENVVSGKLTQLSSTLKTYLFSIGKYTLFNKMKVANKIDSFENYQPEEEASYELEEDDFITERKQQLLEAMDSLGEKCKSILRLFYYQKCTIKEIMSQLNYKNENTVKAHKSRCMKSLRNHFAQH